MKNVILLLGISLFCYGCSCGDPTVIFFTEKDKEWLIYQKGKPFTYTNQKNDTLVYVTEDIRDSPFLDADGTSQVPFPSFGNNCAKTKWEGMQVKIKNITTKKDSMFIELHKIVKSTASGYEKGDGLMPRIYWRGNSYSRILTVTNILDSLSLKVFDTLNMEKLPYDYASSDLLLKKLILRKGKVYDNVLVSQDWRFDNITKTSKPTTKIYYHKPTGIIRFETADGNIWELE
jgi:hypothetical protein